jgi:histidine ammonia-lyase
MSAKIQPAIRPGETFEQPASEKSRGTRDQDALSAQLLPQRLGAREDVIEIVRQPVCRFCVAHR